MRGLLWLQIGCASLLIAAVNCGDDETGESTSTSTTSRASSTSVASTTTSSSTVTSSSTSSAGGAGGSGGSVAEGGSAGMGGTSGTGGDGGSGGSTPNNPPNASFTMNPPCTSSSTTQVTFTSTSTDPDGNPLTCSWVFNSGTPGTANTCVVTGVTFPNVAPYAVVLTVSDGTATDQATMNIAPCQ